MIEYRILGVDEWDRIREIYPEGKEIPSPNVAVVSVAESNGKIVGCWFLQLAWHLEPLIITDRNVRYKDLAEKLIEKIPEGVNFFTRSAKGKKLDRVAGTLGMVNTNEQLYSGIGGI